MYDLELETVYSEINKIASFTDLRVAIGLTRARIVRIYGGFDLEEIRRAARLPEADLPREPFVLHASRFMPQKRHDLLLDAWLAARLPHRLVLLTQASPGLDALIAERGLKERVLVAGFRPNPYPWMRAAELLVLSSEREGMPNVLVEALACGTRVVSTDCPSGPREVDFRKTISSLRSLSVPINIFLLHKGCRQP